ncbi:DUF2332 domain-containing protein [Novosphingopyxis sp.]|uniref:DUF2332 domain-containing protein n=1 Tax=Novosphingopyxis sp. TaxID=2709690 RepID=UPI003B599B4F
MMAADTPMHAFANQVHYCTANDAPITACVCGALAAAIDRSTSTGRAVLDWPGHALADALPLRLAGGVHALWRSGAVPALDALYRGEDAEPSHWAEPMRQVLAEHDAALLPWLDGPPQTNEAGRSASFIAGLHWFAAQGLPPRFEILEIGASAGMNLLLDRYRYDVGGVPSGPENSPVTIKPEWRGAPPPDTVIAFHAIRGCDIAPVDVTDDVAAEKLMAYIWPDAPQRFERMKAGIAMFRADPPVLEAADAADWIERALAEPQQGGVTRVLVHSIMWQYLPRETQGRIERAMETSGMAASDERPLAWLALEADRSLLGHGLTARYWPGGGARTLLATAHAHGAWVEWRG